MTRTSVATALVVVLTAVLALSACDRPHDLAANPKVVLLDVREDHEWQAGHAAGEDQDDLREQLLLSESVHLIMPEGRISVPTVRAFVDFVVPRLRSQFARLSADFEPEVCSMRESACRHVAVAA